MDKNVTQKLIENHLIKVKPRAGEEIGLKIDQTLSWSPLLPVRVARAMLYLWRRLLAGKSTRHTSDHQQIHIQPNR